MCLRSRSFKMGGEGAGIRRSLRGEMAGVMIPRPVVMGSQHFTLPGLAGLVSCTFPSSPSFLTNRKSHVIRQLRGGDVKFVSAVDAVEPTSVREWRF
jgi:hypothetical protein